MVLTFPEMRVSADSLMAITRLYPLFLVPVARAEDVAKEFMVCHTRASQADMAATVVVLFF